MKEKDMVFGTDAIIDAINRGKELDKVFIRRDMSTDISRRIFDALRGVPVPIVKVPVEKLNRFTKKDHHGAVAFLSAITYQHIEDIIPTLYEESKTPFVVVLDGITDAHQFGAIARTCHAASVDAIVLPARGGAFANTDAINASAGYLKDIIVCREADIVKTISFLKESGLCITALDQHESGKNYLEADYNKPLALVFGNDIDGVSNDILRQSDQLIKLPLDNGIEALTVSIGAGIVTFEAKKQRS